MGRQPQDQLAAWAADTRRVGFERRDWRRVRRLAAICVILLLVGLAAYFLGYPPALAIACWAGASIAGVAMLVWFRDPRRFRARPPEA